VEGANAWDLFCGLDIVFHKLSWLIVGQELNSREVDFLLRIVYPLCFVFRLEKDL
jgi:hypothetical protein